MQLDKRRWVYLDYSATTPVKPEVLDAMLPYFSEYFGNPSSIHSYGQLTKEKLEEARGMVAQTINAKPNEIIFTSGGTEANNLAIKGVAKSYTSKGKHFITSSIEHHAVLHTFDSLVKEGAEVTILKVDENGLIDLKELENSIRPETVLVSIMAINNEIGTKQDIKAIGEICHRKGVLFHTDAVQAYGNIQIDVVDMNIDLMTMSSHKIYGPKGTGALYVKKGIRLTPLLDGGSHELKKRAGTENLTGIIGFAKAAELAHQNLTSHISRLEKMRDEIIRRVLAEIPESKLNGHPIHRHPGNAHFCFHYIEGEGLLLYLDMLGLETSSGSACTSGSLDPSHVLMAIGLTHEIAHGSVRISLGDFTNEEDVDYIVESLKTVVKRLREMSPLYRNIQNK